MLYALGVDIRNVGAYYYADLGTQLPAGVFVLRMWVVVVRLMAI